VIEVSVYPVKMGNKDHAFVYVKELATIYLGGNMSAA